MSRRAEQLQEILSQPLGYVHPQRLCLAPALDSPALRGLINHLLDSQRYSADPSQDVSLVAGLWLEHWSLLPEVAALIGAHLAWPHLAQGGRLIRLSASQRVFAAHSLALWPRELDFDAAPLAEQLQALGLNALLAFEEQVSTALKERLLLQFPLTVVTRQQQLPPASADAALLRLAIQHARFYPDVG